VWLERFPQLADVYCFSSDYPHAEGGVDTMEKFYQQLAPFGDEVLTKFFRTNAELLIPSTGQGSVGRS
jgi:predicted TIM-barrel fold metal-dependent hydrolase